MSFAERVITHSPAMVRAVELARVFAVSHVPVVLIGPTGVGKSLLARLLHKLSGRRGPLTECGLGGRDGPMAHDLLCGHEPGAYTDARTRRLGLVATAGTGTLLLDDFHHTSRAAQVDLLDLLERRRYRPTGGDRELPVGCRFVFAAGEDPDGLVRQGTLLPDLRYRMGEAVIRVPALAERREDVAPLAEWFLERCPRDTGVPGPDAFHPDALPILRDSDWPGNVRELNGVVQSAYLHAVAHGAAMVEPCHMPDRFAVTHYDRRADREARLRSVHWALERTHGNVAAAAELLGVHRNAIYKVLRRHTA